MRISESRDVSDLGKQNYSTFSFLPMRIINLFECHARDSCIYLMLQVTTISEEIQGFAVSYMIGCKEVLRIIFGTSLNSNYTAGCVQLLNLKFELLPSKEKKKKKMMITTSLLI